MALTQYRRSEKPVSFAVTNSQEAGTWAAGLEADSAALQTSDVHPTLIHSCRHFLPVSPRGVPCSPSPVSSVALVTVLVQFLQPLIV